MAMEELSGLLRGLLVVGGSTIPSSYVLPALFALFRAKHPGVALQLVTGDSREIVDRLLAADVEVGVIGAPSGERELEERKVGEDRLVLVVPPAHPLARAKGVTVADVAAHPLVLREEGSGTRAAAEKALREAARGKAPVFKAACEVGSTEAIKAAVRAGLGAAFVSNLAIADEVRAGTLVEVPVSGFDVRRPFYLVTRPTAFLSPAAQAFRELAVG
jgi:DNA-binding transcriptional LysR family regulator